MVVVAGIFGSREGASAAVLDAVATGDVRLALSDDQLRELVTVMGYSGLEELIARPVRAFEVALDIGTMGYMYHPRRLDWPSLTQIQRTGGSSTWPTPPASTTSSPSTPQFATRPQSWGSRP